MADVTGTYYPGDAFIGYGAELRIGQGPGTVPPLAADASARAGRAPVARATPATPGTPAATSPAPLAADPTELFVAVPDVTTITPGDGTTGVIDISHLRSPDRHREKKATLRDSGPFTIAGNYRPDHGAHKAAGGDGFEEGYSLYGLWKDVREANFEISMPPDANNGADPEIVLSFVGLVTRYQVGQLGLDNKVEFTAEITPLRGYDWTV